MDQRQTLLTLTYIAMLDLLDDIEEDKRKLNGKRKRKPVSNLFASRETEGHYQILTNHHDEKKFQEFFRLNINQFDYLISLIESDLTIEPCNRVKSPISPREKLAVTLRYLATGESLRSLAFGFRISHSYISGIIKKTLAVLKTKLMPIFLPSPETIDFEKKAQEFDTKWQLPNFCAAIDGKHVRIRCPNNSGSLFHNNSTVLLAIVDANYKFVAVDVGSYGKEGDAGIFSKTLIGKKIVNDSFGFPPLQVLPGTNTIVPPHVLLDDEAFKLSHNLLKPNTKKTSKVDGSELLFNYRLSRARRVTENAFGLLSQVFRIFYQPINLETSTCDDLVWVCCCLHNMLRDGFLEVNNEPLYHYDSKQKNPTDNMIPLVGGGGFLNRHGYNVRNTFKNYFVSEGALDWQ